MLFVTAQEWPLVPGWGWTELTMCISRSACLPSPYLHHFTLLTHTFCTPLASQWLEASRPWLPGPGSGKTGSFKCP